MSDQNTAPAMRGKIVGVLIKDARQVRGKSTEECAAAMGCAPADYAAFEAGQVCPALPELELLAYYLALPLSYFWGDQVLSAQQAGGPPPVRASEVAALRHRIIGALVRQARLNSHLEAADLGLTASRLAAYEFGQQPIPVPELEGLARRLGLPIEHFLEARGPVGEWDSAQRAFERFRQLPPELRDFVSQPVNENYLRLAQRLSQLPVGQLRGLAASLLEITL